MLIFGPIGFTAPLMLWALAALPVLWILLRAVPPAPVHRMFPAVSLLLGLEDKDNQSARTPWWLLILRMLVLALAIVGFAGPVLNPKAVRKGEGPVLVVMDAGWASAADWATRIARVSALVEEAGRASRPVALLELADPNPGMPVFVSAETLLERVGTTQPSPWAPQRDIPDGLADLPVDLKFETWWFSDGLARDGRGDLFDLLATRGEVTVFESGRPVYGLNPAETDDNILRFTVQSSAPSPGNSIEIRAIGPDPGGRETVLASGMAGFEAGATSATLELVLPSELRNRITRFVLADQASAGAVILVDDGLRRREIALISGHSDQETLELLDPLYYLRNALEPGADLLSGTLTDILPANPDVIVFADVAELTAQEEEGLLTWVDSGGLLLRFSGPKLAASNVSRTTEDPLLPVRLRRGGRSVGGTMSWGEPKSLLPFDEDSPFYGLELPGDVSVTSQVVAQPGPELSGRVIASLADGTPLVTRKRVGRGRVVLFHVTANAEWSNLPLSGLFVGMLERLSVSSPGAGPDAIDLEGTTWTAEKVLDGFGRSGAAETMAGIPGEKLALAIPEPGLPPGLYRNDAQYLALNVLSSNEVLQAASWPSGVRLEGFSAPNEQQLKGWLLMLALGCLGLDALASLWLTGRLGGAGMFRAHNEGVTKAGALLIATCWLAATPADVRAQSSDPDADSFALSVTSDVVLAHILTGNREVDQIAQDGLRGLSNELTARTSVEPASPVGVDPERDELSFFPFLYWPVTASQPSLSPEAYHKLNQYLRTGGMILFDTQDAGISGTNGPNQRRLRSLALPLDIPALEEVPSDHVLTRTFYLLQDFPGRYTNRSVWVEAAPPDAELIEGMPFRNLNDGVTPVVIGGNDWAAAWAVNERGQNLFPVGRGRTGERQREIAYRFGINLIMHVLTGNYKSDQVHVPALLDRLGQ